MKCHQLCEELCEQPWPAQQFFPFAELHAAASFPQQPLPSFLAHCLASLPEQQFIADCAVLLSFLQHAISLPAQQDAAFASLPWSFILLQQAHPDAAAGFAESAPDAGACACWLGPAGAAACCAMAGSQCEDHEYCNHSNFHFVHLNQSFSFFYFLQKWEARPTRTQHWIANKRKE